MKRTRCTCFPSTTGKRERPEKKNGPTYLIIFSIGFCRFRQICSWFVNQKWFDNVILLFIALNCITLGLYILLYWFYTSSTSDLHSLIDPVRLMCVCVFFLHVFFAAWSQYTLIALICFLSVNDPKFLWLDHKCFYPPFTTILHHQLPVISC